MAYYSYSLINHTFSVSDRGQKLFLLFVFVLLLYSTSTNTVQGQERPQIEFPTIYSSGDIAFFGVCSSDNSFIDSGTEIRCRDIWIYVANTGDLDNTTFYYEIFNKTKVPRTIIFSSNPENNWLRMNLPEIKDPIQMQVFHENEQVIAGGNTTVFRNGFDIIINTPASELDANLTVQESNTQKLLFGVIIAVACWLGFRFTVFLKNKSPLLNLPALLTSSFTYIGGVLTAVAFYIGITLIPDIVAFVITFILTIIISLNFIKVKLDDAMIVQIDTKTMSYTHDIYDGFKINNEQFEILQEGRPALMRLFGKRNYLRSVKPITNTWNAKVDHLSFTKKVVQKGYNIEYSPQWIEVTKHILDGGMYMNARERQGLVYKKLKTHYNNLVMGIPEYSDALVAKQLYQILSLMPNNDVVESQNNLLQDITTFELKEDWTLLEEVQQEHKEIHETDYIQEAETIEYIYDEDEYPGGNNK